MIRDDEGEALVAVCDQKKHVQNPTVAECHALWKALELCNDLNIQNDIFERDAKVVSWQSIVTRKICPVLVL